ncbi:MULTISPECIES: helix-turn-helix domain-containing protein [unclassified Oceanobacter]|jgi:AraC family transcriptional activator of pobA|uniref:helix-turn-helix domain-containing protein n=1 Tax=unclassified Oceanobacter TaxID=2620260 RepID=UPI0026E3DA13|nr:MULTISPECIES: helix-turn-helix domain-containing protein [unclassified Oceanobacter]MDO6681913.1 helix-turn-helix domain-containing protein [Oceanobacter sp. 5_MG-2023]MDP2505275.1 helix-turn-helix domain-containing protein [Oceanobacter sp. 3_MG-2023]
MNTTPLHLIVDQARPPAGSHQRISRYTLYSEAPSDSDPEFVHIEDIPSRARLFDWAINIHTHPNMFQLIFVRSGSVRVFIDGQEEHHQAPVIVSVPAGVVHGFEFEREATEGCVITVSRLLIQDDQFARQFPFGQELLQSARIIQLSQHPKELTFIDQTVQQLTEEYLGNALGKKSMFAWLLFGLLLKLGRLLEEHPDNIPEDIHSERFRHLNSLIEGHYRQHQSVEFYAQALHTTPTSLSRTCKQIADKNITDLLYDRLVLEAQRMLIYSSVPVSLIAYDLGFHDPAYFSRFFRRRVGLAPTAFREQRDGTHVSAGSAD